MRDCVLNVVRLTSFSKTSRFCLGDFLKQKGEYKYICVCVCVCVCVSGYQAFETSNYETLV
jgi:hypothetical protein